MSKILDNIISYIGQKLTELDTAITNLNQNVLRKSDAYTRSSAGDLEWTTTTEGNSKVIMKSALAFWNGRYGNSASNLAYCNKGAFGTFATKNSLSTSDLPAASVNDVSNFIATDATFTPDRNGVVTFCWRASAAGSYCGISDTTENRYVAQQTISTNAQYASVCFPVAAGHTYKIINLTSATSQVATVVYFG